MSLSLTVVGLQYRLKPGEVRLLSRIIDSEGYIKCYIEREPDNEVDPFAMMVLAHEFDGRHIGYIARPANKALYDKLKTGTKIKSCRLVSVDSEESTGILKLELRPAKA